VAEKDSPVNKNTRWPIYIAPRGVMKSCLGRIRLAGAPFKGEAAKSAVFERLCDVTVCFLALQSSGDRFAFDAGESGLFSGI
jgi:hypothetical protein